MYTLFYSSIYLKLRHKLEFMLKVTGKFSQDVFKKLWVQHVVFYNTHTIRMKYLRNS